ncbi:MAG: proteasome assembly chaperone family protein [Candidatus Aenigmatarchaeota archaeon]|nr:MAG: proteasome assembly chaperone family protein [Candidatus Aenigmarchaeota archaeon]
MQTYIRVLEKPKLKNPILIEGLPGIGNVGRIAAGYLIEELKAKKFAELYSPHFLPYVLLHDNVAEVLKNEFYFWKNPKGDDIIILVGDSQAGDPSGVGHYEVVEKILDFCQELGVKKIFTLGGFATGEIEEMKGIEVLGAVNEAKLAKTYASAGVNFSDTASRIGMIVGATGLLIGLAKQRNMEGVCLMGETAGFPILTDPRAAEKVLQSLAKMLGVAVDLGTLDKRVKEMEEFLKKIEKMQQKAMKQLTTKEGEKLSYIG